MKRIQIVVFTIGSLWMLGLPAGAIETRSEQQSELVERTVLYQEILTPPKGTPSSQRLLLAASLAAADVGINDPQTLAASYQEARAFEDYLPLSDTLYTWSSGNWLYYSRTNFSYNKDEMLTESVDERYSGNSWSLSTRIIVDYDINGRQIALTSQEWDDFPQEWRNEGRTLSEYDGSGNLIKSTVQEWDVVQEKWVDALQTSFTYASGMIDTRTIELWDEDHWELSAFDTYAYNQQDLLATITRQGDYGSGLENANQTNHEYDLDGNLTKTTISVWAGMWVLSLQTDYTYDPMGREILEENGFWTGGNYTLSTSDTTKYDGDRISETVRASVFPGSSLSRTQYMYDDGAMTITTIDQDWDPSLAASPTAEWINTQREITVYDEFATAVQIETEPWSPHYELGQNFPNPFNPTTVIQYSLHRSTNVEINVYNVLGQRVITLEDAYHEPGVYETRWDGRDAAGRAVSSGVYFYRLKAEDQVDTRKMLLLK